GYGRQLAPQRVEGVAVEPAGAGLEPARVDHMRRADFRHVYLQARVPPDERSRRAGVVEVDVRQEQVPDVLQREAARGEPRLERLEARARAAVEEREAVVGVDEV